MMKGGKYRWRLREVSRETVTELVAALSCSAMFAQCLVNRGQVGASDARTFLDPRLGRLRDPFELPQLELAVQRLFQAADEGEPVILFGDYDVDGVTATALLHEVLSALGWMVHRHLPSRRDEGYGLTVEGLRQCLEEHGQGLLLAVDCGSTAVTAVDALAKQGIPVIILDHHQVSDPAPRAHALVNPRCLEEVGHPSSDLCSVGLAFKLAHGLVKEGRRRGLAGAEDYDVRPLLDLVAVGTVADLVPLTGENRTFVSHGLKWLNRTQRLGFRELKRVARSREPLGTVEVGFQLAPRLNAAGRLREATGALDLLLATEPAEARRLAEELDRQNTERQRIERAVADEAIERIRGWFDPAHHWAIVEGCEGWHIGVVGIVAARIMREFCRPAIILGGHNSEWRGSGRSIPGFDLAAALRACDSLLLRHGGHALAAGLSVDPSQVQNLRERLDVLAHQQLTAELLQPELDLDGEWPLAELTLERVRELNRLQPFGQGNRAVQFLVRRVECVDEPRRMGREGRHARFWLQDSSGSAECLCWNFERLGLPEGLVDVAVAPQINEFNGRVSVQLVMLDWRSTQ